MNILMEQFDGMLIIKDEKERVLMKGRGDKIAIARFPDLDEQLKEYLASLYVNLTGQNIEKVKQFLNYEIEEDKFCS